MPLLASPLPPRIAGKWRQLFSRLRRAMTPESVEHITELLRAARAGDAAAQERLLAVVYEQLHQLARARMARLPPGQTLQPTALVHEAYLRLTDKSDVSWESRQHFFFAAARAMRDILVEQAHHAVAADGRQEGTRRRGRLRTRPRQGAAQQSLVHLGPEVQLQKLFHSRAQVRVALALLVQEHRQPRRIQIDRLVKQFFDASGGGFGHRGFSRGRACLIRAA